MKRKRAVSSSQHAQDTGTSYYYLSHQGEIVYAPAGSAGQDSLSRRFTDAVDDTRLPRPSTPSGSSDRSSSVPSTASSSASIIDDELNPRPSPAPDFLPADTPRLGLPKDWILFPLSKGQHKNNALHTASSLFAHGWHSASVGGHEKDPVLDNAPPDSAHLDPNRIDYGRPLSFRVSTESLGAPPSYRTRRSASQGTIGTLGTISSLPPYPGSPTLSPEPDLEKTSPNPPVDYIAEAEDEERLIAVQGKDRIRKVKFTAQLDFTKKPKLQHSRPLPQEFNEAELREIRRKTRHCIRVVTRSSIGLVSTLALSGVAPQLLIAAAINAYCLGRGIHKLHQHLQFLKVNELKVRKRDILYAVAEGVAVKVVFMAITINHDDFIILAHETLGSHAAPLIELLHSHPIPGFDTINEFFIKPMEHTQLALGLPTMAQRAADVGTIFGMGGWDSTSAALLIENVFVIGSVQAAMEHVVDIIQDEVGRATLFIKERLLWLARKRKEAKEAKLFKNIEGEIEAGGGKRELKATASTKLLKFSTPEKKPVYRTGEEEKKKEKEKKKVFSPEKVELIGHFGKLAETIISTEKADVVVHGKASISHVRTPLVPRDRKVKWSSD